MSARVLPRWTVPALPAWRAAPRRRRAVVGAGVIILVLVAGLLVVEWPVLTRPRLPDGADPALAAARAVAVAHARATIPTTAAPRPAAAAPRNASSRVVPAQWVSDLFASHSWYVPPPPPPAPVVVTPPPPPTAPPFPYAYLGSYAPDGGKAVFFLSRADRVLDARVGDRIDGVYEFESADGRQLVFNYLPLNIRQTVPTGAAP